MFTPITQNPQKIIQKLRDSGYVICSLNLMCEQCGKKSTHYWLTPVLESGHCNYETVSKPLKERICKLFQYRDSLLGIQYTALNEMIPDHKFPEDRWDENTAESNDSESSDTALKNKFQILTAQTNLQKQRCCAHCVATGVRGYPLGIKYYYAGNEFGDKTIPTRGKEAEKGCVGCGWYDLIKWKEALNKEIAK